jgi:cation diffusion facilitator family transporter
MEDLVQTGRYKVLIASLSIVSNALLVALKIAVGIAMGSISVVSEALHSGVDVIAAIVATVGVQRSSEPADQSHRFGHGKFENLSGLVQAMLIFFAAAWIVYQAILKLMHPSAVETLGIGVFIMFVSSIVNFCMGFLLLHGAKKTNSVALKADAWHCLTDVYTSLGVMVGLAVMWAGATWFPHVDLSWVDPVVAMAVAILIVKAAWDLGLESARDLLDVSLPLDEENAIRKLLAEKYPEAIDCHKFRGRKSGGMRFVEFHIRVDPAMSVEKSHALCHNIDEEIKRHFPDTDVMVHIEPKKVQK